MEGVEVLTRYSSRHFPPFNEVDDAPRFDSLDDVIAASKVIMQKYFLTAAALPPMDPRDEYLARGLRGPWWRLWVGRTHEQTEREQFLTLYGQELMARELTESARAAFQEAEHSRYPESKCDASVQIDGIQARGWGVRQLPRFTWGPSNAWRLEVENSGRLLATYFTVFDVPVEAWRRRAPMLAARERFLESARRAEAEEARRQADAAPDSDDDSYDPAEWEARDAAFHASLLALSSST